MLECNLELNGRRCTCTYEPCDKKGKCCECIAYHRRLGELRGYLFTPEVEGTFDRSISRFIVQYR